MSNGMGNKIGDCAFTRVEQYSSRPFHEAMRIYRSEFSADSRLSVTRIRHLLSTGSYRLFVAQDAGRVLALALVWVCAQPAFVHLDYLAVGPQWKGRGIGTALYRWLIAHIKDLSPRAQLLTLEVDDALIDFYRRSQTHLLQQVPYLFPGSRGPIPMLLMVYDCRGRKTLGRAVVQGLIRALYRGLHNRAAEDALLRSCIARVPRQVALG
jgi:ribosomal protein S18 acetylase RimI-like enzyme